MSSSEKQKAVHTIEFPITKVVGYHQPSDAFDKRFFYMCRLHNQLVKEAQRRINQLYRNKHYINLLSKYNRLKKENKKEELKQVREELFQIRCTYDLQGKYSLQKYASKIQKKYKNYINMKMVYKESFFVWNGVSTVLFKKGNNLHFKKNTQFNKISQEDTKTGIRFDMDTCIGKWGNLSDPKHYLEFQVKINWDDEYVIDSVIGNKVKYYEIKRRIFKDGYHYYLVLVLDGKAPKKKRKNCEKGTTGIDIGVSSVACVSDHKIILEELAPKAKQYEQALNKIQSKMERSLRLNNPNNYSANGIPKNGIHTWTKTKNYEHLQRQYNTLCRIQSEYVANKHKELINNILDYSNKIIIEPMDFRSLAKHSKKTERSDKETDIVQKDGCTKKVYKHKKKKRFGKSIRLRSPGLFQTILKQKAIEKDVPIFEVNVIKYKASQYHHDTGEYVKTKLSERSKIISGYWVQRDLYSAFIIKHSNANLESPNQADCVNDFANFISMQNETIYEMKAHGISFRQCFGF